MRAGYFRLDILEAGYFRLDIWAGYFRLDIFVRLDISKLLGHQHKPAPT